MHFAIHRNVPQGFRSFSFHLLMTLLIYSFLKCFSRLEKEEKGSNWRYAFTSHQHSYGSYCPMVEKVEKGSNWRHAFTSHQHSYGSYCPMVEKVEKGSNWQHAFTSHRHSYGSYCHGGERFHLAACFHLAPPLVWLVLPWWRKWRRFQLAACFHLAPPLVQIVLPWWRKWRKVPTGGMLSPRTATRRVQTAMMKKVEKGSNWRHAFT